MSAGTDDLGADLAPASELAERAVAAARHDVVVLVEDTSEAEVRFANNTTTTNGVRRDRRVSVVAFVPAGGAEPAGGAARRAGRSQGGVATASVSRSGALDVAALVAEAEARAAASPPADDAAPLVAPPGPPGGPGGAVQHAPAAGSAFAQPPETTSLAAFAGMLSDLGEAFGRARSASRVLAGFATHSLSTTYLASSAGLAMRHVQPEVKLELVARSSDGARSVWSGVAAERVEDVSVPALDSRLAERLGWGERRIELPAGRYEVLLPPDCVADLMIPLYEAAGGRDAEDGASVFSAPGGGTRVGEALTTLPFRLYGDPGRAGIACIPFLATAASGADVSVFDNGLPVASTAWIEEGRLTRLRYHRAGAARAGAVATPPVDNLLLELPGATASLEEMVARTRDRALLLTCLWYVREVDPTTLLLTGLTRDGVYLVEGGEVVGAVNNFRWNESPIDVLARTLEAGAGAPAFSREWNEWMSRTAMPPLRVAEFNMSTVSPAS